MRFCDCGMLVDHPGLVLSLIFWSWYILRATEKCLHLYDSLIDSFHNCVEQKALSIVHHMA